MNTLRVFRQVLLVASVLLVGVNVAQAATTVGTNISTAALTTSGIITSNSPATSTFAGGINLTNGCFALNGTCLTGSDTSSFIKKDGTTVTTAAVPFFQGLNVSLSGATLSTQGNSSLNFNNPFVSISDGVGDPDGSITTPTSLYVDSNFNDDGSYGAEQKAIYGHINSAGSSGNSYAGYFWNEQTDVNDTAYGIKGIGMIGVMGEAPSGTGLYGYGDIGVNAYANSANAALFAQQANSSGYGLQVNGGYNWLGGKTRIGGASSNSLTPRLDVVDTAGNQIRATYDSSNYLNINVPSNGQATIQAVGTASQITLTATDLRASGDLTMVDGKNILFNTSTGSKLGGSTSQKLSFWNATPITQPANTTAIDTLLTNTGLRASGGVANFDSRLQADQPTLGAEVSRLTSVTSNDDPTESVYQNKVTTTDATQTTLATIAIPSSTTVLVEAKITARRTGGSSGTANDSAAYVVIGTYKNVSGTATLVGSVTPTYTAEDQAGWDATLTASSGNALLRVTGAANNNVSWVTTYRVYPISS